MNQIVVVFRVDELTMQLHRQSLDAARRMLKYGRYRLPPWAVKTLVGVTLVALTGVMG